MSVAVPHDAGGRAPGLGRRTIANRVTCSFARRSAALLAVLSLVLTACSGAVTRTQAQQRGSLPSESTSALREAEPPWGNAVSYNPYSPAGYVFQGLAQLELAYLSYRGSGDAYQHYFYPELATSWQLRKASITLHLQRRARWSNGAPLTSGDVLTSLLVAGGDYNEAWADIAAVHTPNRSTVVIDVTPGAVVRNVLTEVVEVPIVPTSQYASLIPKGFEHDLITYWHLYDVLHPTTASVGAAGTSSAGTVLKSVAAKIPSFEPKKLLSDGPYTLSSANSSAVLLKKWPGFWDAKAVRVPWVELDAMDTTNMFGALLGGRFDFEDSSEFLDPDVTKLKSTPDKKYVLVPSPTWQIGLLFHLADYPFGIRAVREALAYALDRTKISELTAEGSLMQNPPTTHPDGMPNIMNNRYLSQSEQSQLNSYPYNTAKAATLLKGAGFTKRNGTWYTPKGKPFSITLYTEAGNVRWGEEGIVVEGALKQFGIPVQLQEIESPGFTTSQEDGDYPVSIADVDSGSFNPLSYFDYTFVTTLNWPLTYNGQGACTGCHSAIGIGPVATVPGLGKVNVEATLNDQLLTAPPSQWSKDVWEWARWVNQDLPIIPLDNTSVHEAYSSERYTDWPPSSKVGLWGILDNAQPLIFMQKGYLRPAR